MLDTVRSLWIGDRLSTLERLTIASFLAHGHPFELFVYGKVANVPPGVRVRSGAELVPAERIFRHSAGPGEGSVTGFANLFRYRVLLDLGEWWTDMDVVLLRPLEFGRDYVFGWEEEGSVGNALLRAPRGSEFARSCYERTSELIPDVEWGQTGPSLVTERVLALGLEANAESPQAFYATPWERWRSLMEPEAPRLESDRFAIHFWNEMLRRNGVDKDRPFPESSVLGRLAKRYLDR